MADGRSLSASLPGHLATLSDPKDRALAQEILLRRPALAAPPRFLAPPAPHAPDGAAGPHRPGPLARGAVSGRLPARAPARRRGGHRRGLSAPEETLGGPARQCGPAAFPRHPRGIDREHLPRKRTFRAPRMAPLRVANGLAQRLGGYRDGQQPGPADGDPGQLATRRPRCLPDRVARRRDPRHPRAPCRSGAGAGEPDGGDGAARFRSGGGLRPGHGCPACGAAARRSGRSLRPRRLRGARRQGGASPRDALPRPASWRWTKTPADW